MCESQYLKSNILGMVEQLLLGDITVANTASVVLSDFDGRLPDGAIQMNAVVVAAQRLDKCARECKESRSVHPLESARLLKDADAASKSAHEFSASCHRFADSYNTVKKMFDAEIAASLVRAESAKEALRSAATLWAELHESVRSWNFEATPWIRAQALPEEQQMIAKDIQAVVREFPTMLNTAAACKQLLANTADLSSAAATHCSAVKELEGPLREGALLLATFVVTNALLLPSATPATISKAKDHIEKMLYVKQSDLHENLVERMGRKAKMAAKEEAPAACSNGGSSASASSSNANMAPPPSTTTVPKFKRL